MASALFAAIGPILGKLGMAAGTAAATKAGSAIAGNLFGGKEGSSLENGLLQLPKRNKSQIAEALLQRTMGGSLFGGDR